MDIVDDVHRDADPNSHLKQLGKLVLLHVLEKKLSLCSDQTAGTQQRKRTLDAVERIREHEAKLSSGIQHSL